MAPIMEAVIAVCSVITTGCVAALTYAVLRSPLSSPTSRVKDTGAPAPPHRPPAGGGALRPAIRERRDITPAEVP